MIRAWWIALTLSFLIAAPSHSVEPKRWHIASAGEFERGNVEGLSVSDEGWLTLAPEIEDIGETGELFIWDLAEDGAGRLYAATGNQGRLFVVEGDAEPRLLFDSPQTQLQSVTVGPDGNIYAGSVPDGIIYRITPEGSARVFTHTGETYVWDLIFDSAGYLYAATGTSGVVLKIDSNGLVVDKVLHSRDRHIMQLVHDGTGGFYAGTDGNGLVYHISQEHGARLIFSADEQEIHTMTIGPDGRLYVGAVRGRTGTDQASDDAPRRGSVYRLEPSGAATRLWQSPYPLIFSMIPFDDTRILVGVGPRGVLYFVDTKGRVERVADLGESQPTAMLKRADGSVILGMGNSGKVRRLGSDPSLRGAFTSHVYDAGLVAEWGRLDAIADIPSGAMLTIESRTGNSQDPTPDWSRWQPLGGRDESTIMSPAARYVQLRALLSRSSTSPPPVLHSLSFTGQQVNVAPRVTAIRIQPYRQTTSNESRNGDDPSDRSTTNARRTAKRSLVVIRWGAIDPNDDKLVYDLHYRAVGSSAWHLLERDVTRQHHLWDTEGAPEGLTVVRVTASDRPSNPWNTAKTAERVSEPFLIDYTGPVVEGLRADVRSDGSVRIRGTGRDATGVIRSGRYSINSDEWMVFLPVDGIFDSGVEEFDFLTEKLSPGSHTIVVRLEDEMENVGSSAVTVDVPQR